MSIDCWTIYLFFAWTLDLVDACTVHLHSNNQVTLDMALINFNSNNEGRYLGLFGANTCLLTFIHLYCVDRCQGCSFRTQALLGPPRCPSAGGSIQLLQNSRFRVLQRGSERTMGQRISRVAAALSIRALDVKYRLRNSATFTSNWVVGKGDWCATV